MTPPATGVGHLARSSVTYAAGRVVAIAVQTLVVACLARALTPDIFGAVAAGLATVAVLDAIAEFGLLPTALVRMGSDVDGAASHAAATTRASILTLAVAGLVMVPILVAYSPTARLATLCLLPSIVIQRMATGHVALRRHRLDLRRLNAAELAGRCLGAGLILVSLTLDTSSRTHIVLIGAATAIGALLTAGWIVDRDALHARSAPGAHRVILVASLPLGLAAGISLLHARADQMLLELFGRQTQLASYSLGYRAVESTIGLLALGSGAAFAYIARLEGDRRRPASTAALRTVSLVGIVCSAGLLLVSVPVGRLLGGARLADAADYVRLLSPIIWISATNALVAQLCVLAGKQRWLLVVAIGATVVNLASGLVAIPLGGAPALALVSVVTEAMVVASTVFVVGRRLDLVDVANPLPELVACAALVVAAVSWNQGVAWPIPVAVATLGTTMLVVVRRDDAARLVRTLVHRRADGNLQQ